MYGYIYITTNLINGKQYIGQKKSDIFLENKYLGSGCALSKSVDKYGHENFKVELIEKCNSQEELNAREYYWIKYYDAVNSRNFYNLREGGNQPGFSEQSREKMRNNHANISGSNHPRYNKGYLVSGENNPMYGKHHTKESREKMSKTRRENYLNGMYEHLHHQDNRGKNNPMYGKYGKDNPNTGKKRNNTTKQLISKALSDRISINNGLIEKRVKTEELNEYLNNGWVVGRRRK